MDLNGLTRDTLSEHIANGTLLTLKKVETEAETQ